nr:hypothetical protein [Tanacetum cinerariifolium]
MTSSIFVEVPLAASILLLSLRQRQQITGISSGLKTWCLRQCGFKNRITVRRDDDKLYKFMKGDFKRLRIQDIEDMLLLLVQGKLTNLTVEERFAFNKKLNLTRLDTYRSDLKRKEAYIVYSNPRGFIYHNKDKKNRLMRIDELHKFSDGTLTDVRTALDDRLKGIRMKYLPQTIWRKSDKDRAAAMIQAIDKMLKTMRIMRSLERYKVVRHKYSNLMIQPKPDGSTQEYPLVSVEILRYDKRSKCENMGIVPTEMELIREHTQQASDTLTDFQIKFSISIGETVTHWFTLIVLSALRRFDNKNTVTLTKPGRMTKPYSSHRFIDNCFNAENLKMEVKISVEVLGYDRKEKSEKLGRVSTEMELILEHTQQGISYEVSVSTEGVEELKRNDKIKGVKKEAILIHLGRNRVNTYAIRNTKLLSGLEDSHHVTQ